jgi:hypothetical protein
VSVPGKRAYETNAANRWPYSVQSVGRASRGEGHFWLEGLRCTRLLPPFGKEGWMGGRGCKDVQCGCPSTIVVSVCQCLLLALRPSRERLGPEGHR